MKLKFNWGTGILLFIIVYLIAMGTFVYNSFQQKVNLVHQDYYPEGMNYQQHIDKLRNTRKDNAYITFKLANNYSHITFPALVKNNDDVSGTIVLYRPSDDKLDYSVPINIENNATQSIDIRSLQKGLYVLKIDWQYGSKKYYFERKISIK